MSLNLISSSIWKVDITEININIIVITIYSCLAKNLKYNNGYTSIE